MSKVTFYFDKEKDIKNIWETCNATAYGFDFSKRMPQELVDFCRKNDYVKSKKFIYNYFKNIYNSGHIKVFVKAINSSWKIIEKKYFRILKDITKKELKLSKVKVYVTLAPRCPYFFEKKTFYINFFANIPTALSTIGHELLHFHFHKYYFKNIEKEIGKENTHMLKESLTVLLNHEFRSLWFVPDTGYESHKELRLFISTKWKEHKDFNRLISECINNIKEEKDVKQI